MTLRKLDAQTRLMGFHGYEGCPHFATDRRGCPTPYLCSERGYCTRAVIDGVNVRFEDRDAVQREIDRTDDYVTRCEP